MTALPASAAPTYPPSAPGEQPLHRVKTIKVKPGDNLSLIFKREGIGASELHRLVTSEPLGKRLRNIFPGHELTFTQAQDGSLLKLAYTPSVLETLEFVRQDGGFSGQERVQRPERSEAYKHGVIQQSLFIASQRAGLPDSLTMRFAQIFQWDVDFVLDIRQGDEFHVVYEELYVGDEFIGFGDILAAEFVNQGRSHRAIRYTDAAGRSDYYTPQGASMRKAFLRAPVEFTRISSNFNMRRVHPLFNRSAPHRGIDYAAPTGTPILAAGNGRVVTASRTEANGNYVVIQHGEQFVTKYLHMSKFGRGIKSGVRVNQGQVIGYVGATGWATGPHLHYEFLVNGVHQNPRTVKLPQAEPIPAKELARFKQRAEPLLAMLDDFKQQVQLARGH
ncbi:MAG: peptidoglycan DD-metalloendopeptidase family protein [Pseudomonadales bacterium]